MPYHLAAEGFDTAAGPWTKLLEDCPTNTVFVTPEWQQLWWRHFGGGRTLDILSVRDGDGLVGLAPMRLGGCKMALVGDKNVCDYSDFIVSTAHVKDVLPLLFEDLSKRCWNRLVLHSIPAGSPTLELIPDLAKAQGWSVELAQEDVCPRAELPDDWETYLNGLTKKDRHELRRKFRRLDSAGDVRFYLSEAPDKDMDDFIRLHTLSREDKAEFMTPEMEVFFREVVTLPQAGLHFVEVDGIRAAAIIRFDYDNSRLLYNSGYDPRFASLSVGLLLKAWAIREAIETGMKCFDFLRGDEPYKYDLGGVDYPIYELTVTRG